MRAQALALALFAITLNLLQPLAHAALLRDGAPKALWGAFCASAPATPDGETGNAPAAAAMHQCCLGLAHAPVLAAPCVSHVAAAPVAKIAAPRDSAASCPPIAIRDGPTRPRGPPLLV